MPATRQRVDQCRVPAVQVPAEVLEEDQGHLALALPMTGAGVTVGIVDAVGGADAFVGKL
jgi:hypothetical protein